MADILIEPPGGSLWNVRLVEGVAVGAVGPGEQVEPQQAGVCFYSSDGMRFRFFALGREHHPANLEDTPRSVVGDWLTRATPVKRC